MEYLIICVLLGLGRWLKIVPKNIKGVISWIIILVIIVFPTYSLLMFIWHNTFMREIAEIYATFLGLLLAIAVVGIIVVWAFYYFCSSLAPKAIAEESEEFIEEKPTN